MPAGRHAMQSSCLSQQMQLFEMHPAGLWRQANVAANCSPRWPIWQSLPHNGTMTLSSHWLGGLALMVISSANMMA